MWEKGKLAAESSIRPNGLGVCQDHPLGGLLVGLIGWWSETKVVSTQGQWKLSSSPCPETIQVSLSLYVFGTFWAAGPLPNSIVNVWNQESWYAGPLIGHLDLQQPFISPRWMEFHCFHGQKKGGRASISDYGNLCWGSWLWVGTSLSSTGTSIAEIFLPMSNCHTWYELSLLHLLPLLAVFMCLLLYILL